MCLFCKILHYFFSQLIPNRQDVYAAAPFLCLSYFCNKKIMEDITFDDRLAYGTCWYFEAYFNEHNYALVPFPIFRVIIINITIQETIASTKSVPLRFLCDLYNLLRDM